MTLLIFLDTETTGIHGIPIWSLHNQIIQITASCPQTGSRFRTLAQPSVPLPPENLSLHDVDPADVFSAD